MLNTFQLLHLLHKNDAIAYAGQKVLLATYEERFVPTYHRWMEDEELRERTGSERLTLEAEYETRIDWRAHRRQGTFIILDRAGFLESGGDEVSLFCCVFTLFGQLSALLGDTNFVQYPDYVEIMVMVAEKRARRRGIGKESVLLMLNHIAQLLDDRRLLANISSNNVESLALFQKLGFEIVEQNEVFKEVSLELAPEKLAKLRADLNLDYRNDALVDELLRSAKEFNMELKNQVCSG